MDLFGNPSKENNYKNFISTEDSIKYINQKIKGSTLSLSYLLSKRSICSKKINGSFFFSKESIAMYCHDILKERKENRLKFKNDVCWDLSFDHVNEHERTKHVHRLHPYKGKFIPQLVEYFLGNNSSLENTFFNKGDTILDPFSGSGTTLVQSSESGFNAIGIDISEFNVLISNAKTNNINLKEFKQEIDIINYEYDLFLIKHNNQNLKKFSGHVSNEMSAFNVKNFDKSNKSNKDHNIEMEKKFSIIYLKLLKKYNLSFPVKESNSFIDTWYMDSIKKELFFLSDCICNIKNNDIRNILRVILSRVMRSVRATKHSDLGTIKQPVFSTYYCRKHHKICKPLFSIENKWNTYVYDTINRLDSFSKLRDNNTVQVSLKGDSRVIDILENIKGTGLYNKINQEGISGIFSSPPYVGVIDYHDQHAYAYEIFNIDRNDDLEIGPLFKGKGKKAIESYVNSMSDVLKNCKKYLKYDYNIFLVANDKFNIYPDIAKKSGMFIKNIYKRPVLNRTESDKNSYTENIFHLKDANND